MLRGAVISQQSTSSKWTVERMRKYFDTVDDIKLSDIEVNLGEREKVLHDGRPLGEYDCIYAKGSFRFAALLRSITTFLADKAYMPIKPNAFTIVHNKLLTHLELEKGGIPMPKTYISSTTAAAKKVLESLNYPIIMKFPSGTQGKGVMFADSYSSAITLLDALATLNQPFIIQEYVETGGTDVRAIVVGDKVVAAMKRKAEHGEKRANIHAGGKGEAYELDMRTKQIAVKTAKLLGTDICGVDILEGHKGPVVIEANISPGLQGITEYTGIDVADRIARFLYERASGKTQAERKNGAAQILSTVGIKTTGNGCQHLLTNISYRGNRILLPEILTMISRFKDGEDVVIDVCKGRIVIKEEDVTKD
ncbi:RimK family alpha-L-glutamate ligase [Candidatus Woesearchaeota archaeon]|nr:RimK family alpha-L-glutamate ligase [Candidatus Woesearchaeota archaeon]